MRLTPLDIIDGPGKNLVDIKNKCGKNIGRYSDNSTIG